MSRLTELIRQAKEKDPALGAELEREYRTLSGRRAFGLNFERHRPEAVELPGRPVRRGDKVRILPSRGSSDRGDRRLWRVTRIERAGGERLGHLEPLGDYDREPTTVATDDLVVVAEFRDPIHPGLALTGGVHRGDDKPAHTVINGENFHVLKALTYTHRGPVDAIYPICALSIVPNSGQRSVSPCCVSVSDMEVHLVDGTYELFRHFYAVPSHQTDDGREVGAVRATVGSVLRMLEEGASHLAVATDHVIESFRNDLWPGYKDGSGVDPDLLSQFAPLEEVLAALGIAVMAMVEHEADDALAALAAVAADDERVERVCICTPDKDLAQCVGGKVVQLDRRRGTVLDADAVVAKYGVVPESIPDWLGLVGDAADGFPGLPGWGAKSAAAVLRTYGHLDAIPDDPTTWDVRVRNPGTLAATLRDQRADALLFRRLATLELDAPVPTSVDELRWAGPSPTAEAACAAIDAPGLVDRAAALAAALLDG